MRLNSKGRIFVTKAALGTRYALFGFNISRGYADYGHVARKGGSAFHDALIKHGDCCKLPRRANKSNL